MKNKKDKKNKFVPLPVILITFIGGFLIYMYPFVADRWNNYVNSRLIAGYEQSSENVSEDRSLEVDPKLKKMLEEADSYNEELSLSRKTVVTEMEDEKSERYESLLDPNETGMMGYIEIPKIDITVPIYHYTSEEVLEKGIGHLHGSSLPVGGSKSHSLLSGHNGLANARLFTDLDELEEGDRFYLHICGRDLAYEVFDIQTVLPEEVENIQFEQEKDLVTLVTCTPYGVNSHRLLVTGKRCDYDLEEKETATKAGQIRSLRKKANPANALVFGFIIFMISSSASIIAKENKEKKANKGEKKE